MAEFVLENNVFELNGTIKQQILGTLIGTKCERVIKINLQHGLDTLMVSFLSGHIGKTN